LLVDLFMVNLLCSKAAFTNGIIRVSTTGDDHALTVGYQYCNTNISLLLCSTSVILVYFSWSCLSRLISTSTGVGKSFVLRVSIFYRFSLGCDLQHSLNVHIASFFVSTQSCVLHCCTFSFSFDDCNYITVNNNSCCIVSAFMWNTSQWSRILVHSCTCIVTAAAGDCTCGFVPWSWCFTWNKWAKHCCCSISTLSLWYYVAVMLLYVLPYHTWCLYLVLLPSQWFDFSIFSMHVITASFLVLYVCYYAFLWLISWVLFLHHTRFLRESSLLFVSFFFHSLLAFISCILLTCVGPFYWFILCVFLFFLFLWSTQHLLRCVDVPITEAQQDFIRDWR